MNIRLYTAMNGILQSVGVFLYRGRQCQLGNMQIKKIIIKIMLETEDHGRNCVVTLEEKKKIYPP